MAQAVLPVRSHRQDRGQGRDRAPTEDALRDRHGAKPLIFLRRWLPDRVYDAFVRRATGMR